MDNEQKDLELRMELVQIIRQVKELKIRATEIQAQLEVIEKDK